MHIDLDRLATAIRILSPYLVGEPPRRDHLAGPLCQATKNAKLGRCERDRSTLKSDLAIGHVDHKALVDEQATPVALALLRIPAHQNAGASDHFFDENRLDHAVVGTQLQALYTIVSVVGGEQQQQRLLRQRNQVPVKVPVSLTAFQPKDDEIGLVKDHCPKSTCAGGGVINRVSCPLQRRH
jgi:hypothetical protein